MESFEISLILKYGYIVDILSEEYKILRQNEWGKGNKNLTNLTVSNFKNHYYVTNIRSMVDFLNACSYIFGKNPKLGISFVASGYFSV